MTHTHDLNKILVIQNAFIGDAILATAVLEKLHAHYPLAEIHFLVRKDAAALFEDHPFIKKLLVFNRGDGKWKELLRLKKIIRSEKYSLAVTLQRFGSSGLLVWLSGAKLKAGFSKNPFSFCFTYKAQHQIGNGVHEIERNQRVIAPLTDATPAQPKLYPAEKHTQEVSAYTNSTYVTISPSSVWFTKKWPVDKWAALIDRIPATTQVYLLGGKNDTALCDELEQLTKHKGVTNLAGKLSFLSSAALIQKAAMNYTNDSAPLHICSATGAPLTAVFCSTVPAFGFGPVDEKAHIAEINYDLDCRPCGLHGYKACPKGHFKCALDIDVNRLPIP